MIEFFRTTPAIGSRVTALVELEYKVLQGKQRFLQDPCIAKESQGISLQDFVILEKQILRFGHGKSCDSLQENVFQNAFSCILLADLKKLYLGLTYALGAPRTQLKLVLCPFYRHKRKFP